MLTELLYRVGGKVNKIYIQLERPPFSTGFLTSEYFNVKDGYINMYLLFFVIFL